MRWFLLLLVVPHDPALHTLTSEALPLPLTDCLSFVILGVVIAAAVAVFASIFSFNYFSD